MEEKELINCIMTAKKELDIANQNFELAEAEMVDYYSYQIKANKAKLDYLIKMLKRKAM